MTKILLTLSLVFTLVTLNYSQFIDNFTDGDFTANPIWTGNSINFQVTGNELQLNAPAVSGSKYLSTNSQAINTAVWEFKVRMTFNPSSSNYAKVYLVSNSPNISGSLNGYYVKIGGTEDEISLYSQSGVSSSEIIDGRNGVVGNSTNTASIRVTRSTSGAWQLFSDTSSTATFISEGTITENSHTQSLYFGVECNFTSTRSNKFFFDNFTVSGTAAIDNTKPLLDSVNVVSNTQLDLVFDEPLDAITSQTIANYSADNGIGNPISAIQNTTDLNRVTLNFSSPFSTGVIHNLTVNNLTDIAGNSIVSTALPFMFFVPAVANYRDVVINEIFADPSPVIGLPDGEFIEIHNTSTSKIFDLKNWKFTDGISSSTLPTYTLSPNSYVVLFSNSSSGDFSIYSNKISLTSFPSLNNSGETLELIDNNGVSIDKIEYDLSTYQNETKDDGGWSLEQINPTSPCFNPNNWSSSTNSNGGTPGAINSINSFIGDNLNPSVISSFAISNNQIEIVFSETIDTSLFFSSALLSDGRTITSYSLLNSFGTKLLLTVSPVLDTGKKYLLTIDSLMDCSGNLFKSTSEIYLANLSVAGAIILNEILFDPFTDGEDFVELYNNSNLYINLKDWSLANDNIGLPDNIKTIEENYIIKPNEYVVITKNYSTITSLYKNHSPNKYLELETLPTYSNEEGTVYILTPSSVISDKFYYLEDYHFGLLRSTEGVSLERIFFDKETNEKSNWHSAATEVGYATPGLKNSHYNPSILSQETIEVSPRLFSPDNDGFEDILTLSYSLEESGYVGNVSIYDAKGRLIKTLVQNQLLAKEGAFTWDGTTNLNTKARMGAYIILFEFFDLGGNVKTVKKSCALAHRL